MTGVQTCALPICLTLPLPPLFLPNPVPSPPPLSTIPQVEIDYYLQERARQAKKDAELARRDAALLDRRAALDRQAAALLQKRRLDSQVYGKELELQMAQAESRKAAQRAEASAAVAVAVIGAGSAAAQASARTAEAARQRAYREELDGQVWARQQVSQLSAEEERREDRARLDEVALQMRLLARGRAEAKATQQQELAEEWAQQLERKKAPVVYAKPVGVVPGTRKGR